MKIGGAAKVIVLVGTKVGVSSHVRVKLPYSPQRLEDEDAAGPDISLDTIPLPGDISVPRQTQVNRSAKSQLERLQLPETLMIPQREIM